MTIQLATRDLPASTSSSGCEGVVEASIGIDLTLLGAAHANASTSVGAVLPVGYANFSRLVSSACAAMRGGIDFVSLDKTFRSRSDDPRPTEAVKVAAWMLSRSEGGVSVEVPPTVGAINAAVGILSRSSRGRATIAVEPVEGCDLAAIAGAAAQARSAGIGFAVRTAAEDLTPSSIKAIARFADSVHLLTGDPHRAREARFALRSAAAAFDRQLTLLTEIGIIVSGSMPAARERSLLVETMTGRPVFDGKASVVGTVYDVADTVEEWICLGAVDGIVFLPASLPTDLASVIRGIMPLLYARGIDTVCPCGHRDLLP